MEIVHLAGYLKLKLTGADRLRWLNGQVTQDVRKALPETQNGLWSCICNHKGKLNGIFTVSATPDALWIAAEPTLAETLPMRLERYIIADDVTLEDVSDQFEIYHQIPPVEAVGNRFNVHITRFGQPGIDDWLPANSSPSPANVLSAQEAEYLRIASGHPAWDKELTEDTLPPEAGLEDLTVDYHKGCYTGQEVISRMKTAGKTNRRLAKFTSQATQLASHRPQPLHNAQGTEIGHLTSLATHPGKPTVALGYLLKAGFQETEAKLADGTVFGVVR